MSINMPTDLTPDKLTPEARKVREEFRERFRKIAGYYPPAFAAVGFDGAWALFKYVLPKAGRMDPDAIRKAALEADVAEGSLPLGWGVKFSPAGQNTRAFVGVTQWQNGKLVLVWPEHLGAGKLMKVEGRMFKIGIDVGGTFTDIVVEDAKGALAQGKVPSVPGNESEAVMGALRLMAEQLGLELPRFLEQAAVINFGTTVATNAMLQNRGVPTAMLTTHGFHD